MNSWGWLRVSFESVLVARIGGCGEGEGQGESYRQAVVVSRRHVEAWERLS